MESIKVVSCSDSLTFEKRINNLLSEGYVLHGDPQYKKVSCSDTWMGRKRGWTEQTYVQVLKLNK